MTWTVLEVGALVTVQDAGRAGWAHLGVPRAGWLDGPAARLANRLVGNLETAAVLEVTLGGIRLRSDRDGWVAVTGAACDVEVDGSARAWATAQWLPAGSELRLGVARDGVRSYLAVSGGIDVDPVLGSRSTDTLAWVGPPTVTAGRVLRLGVAVGPPRPVDVPGVARRGPLRIDHGPGLPWFADQAFEQLCATDYEVTARSNRIGLRLRGAALERSRRDELPSQGMVLGAVQVPPDGQPVVFLADHPTTGGYPVVAVVRAEDLSQCAQVRPGDRVTFTGA